MCVRAGLLNAKVYFLFKMISNEIRFIANTKPNMVNTVRQSENEINSRKNIHKNKKKARKRKTRHSENEWVR